MKPFTSAFASTFIDALREQTGGQLTVHNLSPITVQHALDAAVERLRSRAAELAERSLQLYRDLDEQHPDPKLARAYASVVEELALALDALGR